MIQVFISSLIITDKYCGLRAVWRINCVYDVHIHFFLEQASMTAWWSLSNSEGRRIHSSVVSYIDLLGIAKPFVAVGSLG